MRQSRLVHFAVLSLTFSSISLLAQNSPGHLTAAEVMQRVIEATGATPPAGTVDTLKAGDPNSVVTGIVTTFMDTYPVLEQAVASGKNLIITHEPTFYNHLDNQELLAADPVQQENSPTFATITSLSGASTTLGTCANPMASSPAWSSNSAGSRTRAPPIRSTSRFPQQPSARLRRLCRREREHARSASLANRRWRSPRWRCCPARPVLKSRSNSLNKTMFSSSSSVSHGNGRPCPMSSTLLRKAAIKP